MQSDDVARTKLHERLRARVVLSGLNQEQLAKQTGISVSSISRKLRGLQPITLDDVEVIAKALGIGVADFFPAPMRVANG